MKSTKADWMIPAILIALSLVPALAGAARVAQLAAGAEITPGNARFIAAPLPVLIHILGAIPYSVLGAFQFSPGFRRRHRRWHRGAGKVLLLCGFMAALSGLWMAHVYPWPQGDGQILYLERLIVGFAMLVSLGIAVNEIGRRDYVSHGRWMIRAYAMGLGAGTQVLTHLPWFMLSDEQPGELSRAVMMGAAWVINAAVAEWFIRKRIARTKHVGVMRVAVPGRVGLNVGQAEIGREVDDLEMPRQLGDHFLRQAVRQAAEHRSDVEETSTSLLRKRR